MTIPEPVKTIIRELWARFPPDQSSDDSRRAFMQKVGEQLGWSVSLAWGYYKTQGDNPPSKDLLPYLEPNGTKHGWDIIVGGGGGLNLAGMDQYDTPEAEGWVFHPLTPLNHLDAPAPPAPDLEARVAVLEARSQQLRSSVEEIKASVTSLTEQMAALPPPADPSEWEAAGKFGWWGVTLPLRRKAP